MLAILREKLHDLTGTNVELVDAERDATLLTSASCDKGLLSAGFKQPPLQSIGKHSWLARAAVGSKASEGLP